MTDLLKLIKTNIINDLNINKFLDKQNRKKLLGRIFLVLLVIAYLVMIIVVYTTSALKTLEAMGKKELLIPFAIILTVFLNFISGVFRSKGTIFNTKDLDFLFSLPIKKKTILNSKIITLLSYSYLFTFLILIPVFTLYAIKFPVGINYYINAVIAIIFTPFIPTAISSLVGYVIAIFTAKSKNKKLVETVATFIIVIMIMFLPTIFSFFSQKFNLTIETIFGVLEKVFYPHMLISNAIILNNMSLIKLVTSSIVFIGINVLVIYIFTHILNIFYEKILLRLSETRKNKKYVEKKIRRTSIVGALFKKECRTFISIPTYVVNATFGIIMMVIAIVYTFFFTNYSEMLNTMAIPETLKTSYIIVIMTLYSFVITMSSTTSSAISLESSKINLIKSLPISIKDIFKSKILLNILIVLPASLLTFILIGIALKLSILQFVLVFAHIILISYLTSYFGLNINLSFPKLDFKTEVQVVKQSISVFIATFAGMIYSISTVLIYNIVSTFLKANYFALIVIVIEAILLYVLIKITNSSGKKKFEKLEGIF